MNRFPLVASFAAAAFVTAFAPADLRVALARGAPAPSASPTLEPTATPTDMPSPTPLPTLRPHHLTITPVPLHPRRPRPTPPPTPSPSPEPTETPAPTPSPTPPHRHRALPSAAPTHPPTPLPTPVPTLIPTPRETLTPEPPPSAEPTPRPTRAPRTRGHGATPTPAATDTPEPTPAPTLPIPTLAPTGPPITPFQPSLLQTLSDPSIQNITHRTIHQLSAISWMSGTWRARSTEQVGVGRTRYLGLNTYVFGFTMHGRWLFGADGKASDFIYITYDPFAHRWVLARLQGNPSYGIWISEGGWKGNRIVFETTLSYANGHAYHRRLTIIHKDARTFGIYDEEQLPDGSWTADDAVELSKQL